MDTRPLPPALRCVICGNGEGKDVDSCPLLQLLMGHCGGANRNGQLSTRLLIGRFWDFLVEHMDSCPLPFDY